MADGDQERFGDYLELENYIDALQAGKAAHPPANLTLEQIRIYQMAALFRSAADEVEQPRPEFIMQLKAQLLELSDEQETVSSTAAHTPAEPAEPAEQTQQITPQPPMSTRGGSMRRARFFSRRGLLTGGAVAAASLVVGGGVEYARHTYLDKVQKEASGANGATQGNRGNQISPYPADAAQTLAIGPNIPTTWHFVTSVANLGQEAVRFTSDTMVGYVLRVTYSDGTRDGDYDTIIALSAACTHMGCLVQWKSTERHFYCPCHEAIFGMQGALQPTGYKYALPPLPRLNTVIRDGNIYVELPRPH